jgi:predicted ATPase
MLTSLRIRNFKAWKDTGQVRLAPLTVIFGANSAGKSSLGHLLLALKQTALSADRHRALNLGDSNSLIDLGTFDDCLHHHERNLPLSFYLAWRLPEALEVVDPLHDRTWRGDGMALDVVLRASASGQPEVEDLRFDLREGEVSSLDVSFRRKESGEFDLKSKQYRLVRTQGRAWPLDAPEKFYRIPEQTRARYQNAGFLSDFALATEGMLNRLYYLGPLRDYPRRIYQWSGDTPEDVGQKGEHAIAAILAAQARNRQLGRGPRKRQQPFAEFIGTWLKDLGIIHSFSVRAVAEGRKEYEVLVKAHGSASEVKITDVGFGVSQVLPALVEAFYCPPGSTVWMEQPEIHLHPQVQAELADVFISAVQAREDGADRQTQLIVESHSEHFLTRLQRRIAEGALRPEDVAIYFCRKGGRSAELEPLRVNLYGEIENWPEDFFGDEMGELTARTVAATRRRQAERGK